MNSEITPQVAFPALPVRRREILEILDTALKLYRRYFWVLIGWSALVSVMSLVPILGSFTFFLTPLLYGAVSCCVAGAVRGQKVSFSQCWSFSKPRYGSLLGVVFLSYIVFAGAVLAFYIAAAFIGLLGFWALSNAPQPLQVVGAVVGALLGIVGFSTLGVVAFSWMNMVPIVACLEDDKRGTASLGRALELLKGQWRRVFWLSMILGFAVLAVFGIVAGVYSLVVGFASLRAGNAILNLIGTFGVFMALFLLIWNPAQSLVISVLYLDLRVRREALDLEWTAYASAPAPVQEAVATSYPNTFSASAPVEFDFLRPDAVSSVANLNASSTEPATPVAPQQPTMESPASFAAGGGFNPGNAPLLPQAALENAPRADESATVELDPARAEDEATRD